MHWLLQDKFTHDPKYRELKEVLARFDIPHTMVKAIPFTDDGIEFPDGMSYESLSNTKVFSYGSYTLAKIAAKHFTPGAFVSPDIAINNLLTHYCGEMFNDDMVIAPLKDLDTDLPEFFIRPVEDTKSFCGEVVKLEYFKHWKEKVLTNAQEGYATITPDTMSVIAPVKPIHQEIRFFVVNGRIATASQYKLAQRPCYDPMVDQYVTDYVNHMIQIWQPDRAFCMDIAITSGVPKILECNCINASGMYAIDVQKFVMAVEDL